MPIPDFADGLNLPPGVHPCTWEELVTRFCNGMRRQALCERMQRLFQQARDCGFVQVIVGGSFPTAKQEPGDFDIAWIVHPGVNKDAMSPDCLKLVESEKSKDRFGCDVFYLPFAGDAQEFRSLLQASSVMIEVETRKVRFSWTFNANK